MSATSFNSYSNFSANISRENFLEYDEVEDTSIGKEIKKVSDNKVSSMCTIPFGNPKGTEKCWKSGLKLNMGE